MSWLRAIVAWLNAPIGAFIPDSERSLDLAAEIDVLAQSSELSSIPASLRRELSEAVASSDTERARVLTRRAFAKVADRDG